MGVARARSVLRPRSSASGRPGRRLAHGHRLLRRPPALARLHVPVVQRRSLGRSAGCPSDCWPRTAALYAGGVVGVVAWLGPRIGEGWALAMTPVLWVAGEWIRGHLMGGFPWGLMGYSQHGVLPVIQIAELAGRLWRVLSPRRRQRRAGGARGSRLATRVARRARRPARSSSLSLGFGASALRQDDRTDREARLRARWR